MSEKIFNALIKNNKDEALNAFKDAIQQKINTAMDVRRVGLTSQIFNDGDPVPVEEEVQIDEAIGSSSSHHHVLKGKVVASGSKSDIMKLVKKNGATVHKGANSNYILYSPGAKVGDVKEEVQIDEALKVGQKVKVRDKGKMVSGVITNVGKGLTLGVADVKLPDGRINVYGTDEINEEVDLDESSADNFVKGGSDKIKQSEVDTLLGKIYDNTKLTKSLIANKAYSDGENSPKGKNPHQKDTVDFHLFQLGQQVELSRS